MESLTYLYGDKTGCVELLASMGSDLDVVNAARVSYDKSKKTLGPDDTKLIKYLLKHGHTSPFEHNVLKFRCYVPLFVARQHMRHRTWSYNEVSRRYTSVNLEFYTPSSFRSQHKSNRQASNEDQINPVVALVPGSTLDWATTASEALSKHTEASVTLYENLLEHGVTREQARMVLPQNMYCKYIATANLHNILRFISLRACKDSQKEMQLLAQVMGLHVKDKFPATWEAFTQNKKELKTLTLNLKTRKNYNEVLFV